MFVTSTLVPTKNEVHKGHQYKTHKTVICELRCYHIQTFQVFFHLSNPERMNIQTAFQSHTKNQSQQQNNTTKTLHFTEGSPHPLPP